MIRESYIKKKWVERAFVGDINLSPLRCKRKWSVRKLRRRAVSRDKVPTLLSNEVKDDGVENEVAIVGEELDTKEPLPGVIDLESDDSTEGEDNVSTGKKRGCFQLLKIMFVHYSSFI